MRPLRRRRAKYHVGVHTPRLLELALPLLGDRVDEVEPPRGGMEEPEGVEVSAPHALLHDTVDGRLAHSERQGGLVSFGQPAPRTSAVEHGPLVEPKAAEEGCLPRGLLKSLSGAEHGGDVECLGLVHRLLVEGVRGAAILEAEELRQEERAPEGELPPRGAPLPEVGRTHPLQGHPRPRGEAEEVAHGVPVVHVQEVVDGVSRHGVHSLLEARLGAEAGVEQAQHAREVLGSLGPPDKLREVPPGGRPREEEAYEERAHGDRAQSIR